MNRGDALKAALTRIESERFVYDNDMRGPFKVGDWVYGTNGHILVAAPSALCPDVVASSRLNAKVLPWLTEECQDGWALDSARLKAFAGIDVPEPPPCKECGGDGSIKCDACDGTGGTKCECVSCGDSHDRNCDACDSEGAIECDACGGGTKKKAYARFCGAVINRALLAKALRAVRPDDGVSVSVVRLSNSALRLSAPEGWIAIVMPLRDGIEPTSDYDKPETWAVTVTAADASSTQDAVA